MRCRQSTRTLSGEKFETGHATGLFAGVAACQCDATPHPLVVSFGVSKVFYTKRAPKWRELVLFEDGIGLRYSIASSTAAAKSLYMPLAFDPLNACTTLPSASMTRVYGIPLVG